MTPDDAQMTALGEQAKLFNIAIKHTGGDMEKARLMVAGPYEDVVVIKGKLSLPALGKYGVFLIFLNIVTRRLANVNSLVLSDAGFTERTRIFDAWRLFNSDFRSAARSAGDASSGSYEFSAHLADSLDGYDIYTPIDAWDLDAASDIVSEIIEKFYRGESPQCQIELEKTSSLAMELEGVQIEGQGEVEGLEVRRRASRCRLQLALMTRSSASVSSICARFFSSSVIAVSVRSITYVSCCERPSPWSPYRSR